MRKRLKAFRLGIAEYRYDVTTWFPEPYIYWYDMGREIMCRFTGRTA